MPCKTVQTPKMLTFVLPIALRHTLQLVLLLNGVRVAASLGSVDKFLGQALCNALDVTESSLTSTDGEERDGLVHTTKRGHVDSLTTDSARRPDTCAVFARAAVHNGVDGNLDGILVRHNVDDLEGVSDDSDGHELLAVVAAVHHQGVGETLDDWALSFSESLDCISTGGV